MSPLAQTLLDNFAGLGWVSLAEVKARCGFSTHQALVAASELRGAGLLEGGLEWGALARVRRSTKNGEQDVLVQT